MNSTLKNAASRSRDDPNVDALIGFSGGNRRADSTDERHAGEVALVYVSPVPLASFTQRPHAFVGYFRSIGVRNIIWLDPYPTRLPKFSDFRRLNEGLTASGSDHEATTLLKTYALPVEPLPGIRLINDVLFRRTLQNISKLIADAPKRALVVGKPSLLAVALLNRVDWDCSLYDAMDHFPLFYTGLSRRSMARVERRVCNGVDAVISGSRDIASRLARWKSEIVLNGYEPDALPKPRQRQQIANPVLGYVGTIAHWFDWSLVVRIARGMPQAKIRLIGPVITQPPTDLPDNIELLGSKPHREAMLHVAKFDIGLIPFKRLQLTSGVDPLKYYEYRALGLPVITTDFGEMTYRSREPGVYLVGNDPMDAIRNALADIAPMDAPDVRTWQERLGASQKLGALLASLELATPSSRQCSQ